MGGGRGESGRLDFPICKCKKVLNFSAPVKLLFSCMTMCNLFLKPVLRCVGVCFCDIYIYIYIHSRMGMYIYIYTCLFGMVLFTYLGLHALYILDVHGFGFWKNKLRLSVLMKLYFSFSQKEAESSF